MKRFASWKNSKVNPGVREEAERLLEGFATPEKRTQRDEVDSYDKEKVTPIWNEKNLAMNAAAPPQKLRGSTSEVRPGHPRFPEPASALNSNNADCFTAQFNSASTIWTANPIAGLTQRSATVTKKSQRRILQERPFRLSKAGTLGESRFGDLWRQMRGPAVVPRNAKMISRRNRSCGHPIRELMKGSVAEERGNKAVAHSVIGQERRCCAREGFCGVMRFA